MKKKLRLQWLVLFSMLFFLPGLASAELYKWRDSEGMLHVTDDLHKVPRDQRPVVEVLPATPIPESSSKDSGGYSNGSLPGADGYYETRGFELYGGESLEWWASEFERLRTKAEWLERNNKNMKEYIAVFEGGRRFGQVFGYDEVARYKESKRDLPEDEALLVKVREELSTLTQEAIGYGVPEDIINK